MPMIDMPLHQLQEYQGINPKPADFEAFWDTGIAEMKSLIEQYELIPSAFQVPGAECFDLYFTGVGGSRIYAKYARPSNRHEKIPAVVQFHGYSGKSQDWDNLLGFVATGQAIASMDCRGQAGLSEDMTPVVGNTYHGHIIRGLDEENPESMYYRQVFLDTAQLANIVMNFDEVDETKVGATGGSQGGGLAVACASLEPKIYKVGALYPFLSDYQRVWDMDMDKNAYTELRNYFRSFDPQHKREQAIFTKLGYIDIQHMAHRIRGSVLWCVGLMDEICPPSTQYAAYNKIFAPKEMIIYPDFGHEGLPESGGMILRFLAEE